MNETKIKAVLVELTQNPYERMVDGTAVAVTGKTYRGWYQNEQYPVEVFEPGEYWKFNDSILHPATPDGTVVYNDRAMLADCLDELGLCDLIGEALALEPGQWVEREYSDGGPKGCRARATAHAELPPLSADRTICASDLSREAMTVVKVNGEALFKPLTVWGDNCVWCPDFYDFAANAIVEKVRTLGGNTATVTLKSGGFVLQDERATLAFAVEARSKAALETFLRSLGVVNPDAVKVDKTVGDSVGVVRVCVTLAAGNIV